MEIRSNNKAKHRSQKVAFGIFRLLSLCIVLILFAILGFIVYKGIGAISWDFITSAPTDGSWFLSPTKRTLACLLTRRKNS